MEVKTKGNVLEVSERGMPVLRHSEARPFAESFIWRLSFRTRNGAVRTRRRESSRDPLSACEVLSSDEKRVRLSFRGRETELKVSLERTETGVEFHLEGTPGRAWAFSFDAGGDEAFFGGGERYGRLNLRGERLENLVSEHFTLWPMARKVLFPFIRFRDKSPGQILTYAPMSTYVSSGKYALRFRTSSYGEADFTEDSRSVFRFASLPEGILLVREESFDGIARKLAADVPVNERLPEWCHDGMILGVQGGLDRAERKADGVIAAGGKVCGVWCQDWSGKIKTAEGSRVFWNWEADPAKYGDLGNRTRRLREKGVRFLAYINPYLAAGGPLFNHCRDRGLLIKNASGGVYLMDAGSIKAGMFDLTNPETVSYLKDTVIRKNMLDMGVDGYMADFGEYLPFDCVLHDGDPLVLHNEWPVLWAKINREAVDGHPRGKEVFIFTRSAYNGAQTYTHTMWAGDQHTDFTKDYGLPGLIPATLNLGFSGMPVVHSDIGGFTSFGSVSRTPEMYCRWIEMNCFSPLMRSHESIRPDLNVQYDHPGTLRHTVKFTNIRARIKPYVEKVLREAEKGVPAMRPDFWFSGDYSSHSDDFSYFFGDEIFVAPVIEAGASERELVLPSGRWIHFFSGKEYAAGRHVVKAPLGMPPVFYAKGGEHAALFARALGPEREDIAEKAVHTPE